MRPVSNALLMASAAILSTPAYAGDIIDPDAADIVPSSVDQSASPATLEALAPATGAAWDLSLLESPSPDAAAPAGAITRVAGPVEPAEEVECAPDCVALPPQPLAGRMAGTPAGWTDHVPADMAQKRGFFAQLGTVKYESLAFLGYFATLSSLKLFKETEAFHFKDEGWFGKDTANIGVDKLTHAFDTYLLAEFLHDRIHRRSGASKGDALTAAVIASGLMFLNEFSDGIEPDSGFSMQDIAMNVAGAGFSLLRNTVPGLKKKVAFKVEIVPNKNFYSFAGKPHYAQQRFFFAIKGSGFEKLEKSPMRYLDLQVGYYASDFLLKDRDAGKEPKRHLFVGVGLNLGELLFGQSTSRFGRSAYSVLDYVQAPYTSLRYDTTGRFGS